MNIYKNIIYKINNQLLIIIIIFFISNNIFSEEIIGNSENGKKLFKKHCTACHSINLNKELIGPALAGITKIKNLNWLKKWIKDNKSMIKSGDKDAIAIYEKYNKIEMNVFPQLSNQDINDILLFIETNSNPKIKKSESVITDNNYKSDKNFFTKIIIIEFILLIIIVFFIFVKIQTIYYLFTYKKSPKNIIIQLFNYLFIIYKYLYILFLNIIKITYIRYVSICIIILLSIYSILNFLMNIDVNTGYKPKQPIHFSHKIHTGINKIDCQYCHSSAKYGKVAGIPSVNLCMNCHNTITQYNGNYIAKGKNKEFYTKEIQKIYKAIGWNPKTREYYNNIEPIQWIRIHNMPDFVYFDHSQHVIIGEKIIKKHKNVDMVCKACHGEVEKMDEIFMANNFTMKWCISCHKTIEIINNTYNINYYKKLIKKHNTISSIGGIDCAKCHY
ncbi:MAG: c-type cytochrome [Candidatus Bostrichicola ureolyticus]|nr:MAG: c-type cytochrome [Candidatus Bostrichicola ureolyticus]